MGQNIEGAVLDGVKTRPKNGEAWRRVVNLLARHPDLVSGHLDRVASMICQEASMAMSADTVVLWRLAKGDARLLEVASNLPRIEELAPREFSRRSAPGLFRDLDMSRVVLELDPASGSGMGVAIHFDGKLWGMLTLESNQEQTWLPADIDLALLLAEMVGRCCERSKRRLAEQELERGVAANQAFSRMLSEAICFEVIDGVLVSSEDLRRLLGNPSSSGAFEVAQVVRHIREDQQGLTARRYRDWLEAGCPGVLTARFHYDSSPLSSETRGREAIELTGRLMRSRVAGELRMFGVLQAV